MQKVDSRKITLIVLFILILGAFALLISKFTFAYLGPDIDEEQNVQGEVTTAGDTLIFSKGNDLSLSPSVDNFSSSSGNLTATTNPSVRLIANTKSGSATAKYYSGILINENTYTYSKSDNTAELILTVRDETGSVITSTPGLNYVTVNGVSGFDITGKTGAFNIVSEKEISTTSTTTGVTQTWTYTITFINFGAEQDQSINENAKLDAVVALTQKEVSFAALCEKGTFACEIANKYTEDRNDKIYYHDLKLVNSAEDFSYRYSGSNPDNWVCFGYNNTSGNYSESWCPDDNLYRIIGIFNEKNLETGLNETRVKLIKAYEAGENLLGESSSLASQRNSEYYIGKLESSPTYWWNRLGSYNVWSDSDLNKEILNNDNDNFLKSIDFEWKSKIAETSWKIGGLTNVMVNAKTMFQQEVLNPLHDKNGNKTYEAKIGLMYLSDYGFAALPQYWENSVTNYSVGETRRNNWLYLGVEEWTISRNASDEDEIQAYGIYWYSGGVVNAGVSSSPMVIRPTFYLKSDVKLTGGSGTESDPYRIA